MGDPWETAYELIGDEFVSQEANYRGYPRGTRGKPLRNSSGMSLFHRSKLPGCPWGTRGRLLGNSSVMLHASGSQIS